MSNSSSNNLTQTNNEREKRWCPVNMEHSHIGEFINYFQGIVEIEKEYYLPLIENWGNGLSNEDVVNSKLKKTHKDLLEKVKACNQEKTKKENELKTLKLPKPKVKGKKDDELEKANDELEKANDELKKANDELKKHIDNNFYDLLLCVYDNKSYIEAAAKVFILRLFNHLVVSILKAEYSLFDNYSDILSKITGFEYTPKYNKDAEDVNINENFKIKDLYKDRTVELKEKTVETEYENIIFLSKCADHYLIKSTIKCIWYLIEICKTIDHKINKNKYDSFFQVVNKNREQRINTIYLIHEEKELINREIIELFALSLESILDLTLIDHYFCYTKENVDKLFIANERISSLYNILEPDITRGLSEKKYIFLDSLVGKEGNLFNDFKTIKNIVELKSKLLLKQLKESFDRHPHPVNNKKFIDQFNFLFYGVKNEDDTENFEEYINNSSCFDFKALADAEKKTEGVDNFIKYNSYTCDYLGVFKREDEQRINIDDTVFSFLIEYNEGQYEKCEKKCKARNKKICEKHCATGICNTKRDIIDFNNCSKISIANFKQNSQIIAEISKLNDNDKEKRKKNYQKLISAPIEFSKFLHKVIDTFFQKQKDEDGNSIPKCFDDTKLQILKLNPTNLTYFIKFFHNVLDYLLDELLENEKHQVVDFKDKLEKINTIYYQYYKVLINEFDAYIKAKENTAYTIGEFRFPPPFQYCFYQLTEDKNGKNILQFYKREEDDLIKEINDDTTGKFLYYKNNIESDNFFFFLSAGLHPVNIFQLLEENKKFQGEFSHIRNQIRALKSKQGLIELSNKYVENLSKAESALEKAEAAKTEITAAKTEIKAAEEEIKTTKTQNIATLGILGSFIAFVSFTTGALKAVDTIVGYVIFAFVFCIAIAIFGIVIKLGFEEIKKIVFNANTNKLRAWVTTVIVVISTTVLVCLGIFCWKAILYKNLDRTIIEKVDFHIKENTFQFDNSVQSERQTIEKETNVIQQADSLKNL